MEGTGYFSTGEFIEQARAVKKKLWPFKPRRRPESSPYSAVSIAVSKSKDPKARWEDPIPSIRRYPGC